MKKLTLYYPEILRLDETFIKAVSLEVWVQSPNTQLWHCAMMKQACGKNYEARILGNKTCIPELKEQFIHYFSSWSEFFNEDKENANQYPIRLPQTFLTLEGAAAFNQFWVWKQLSTGQLCYHAITKTAEELFEAMGFGAININLPIKGQITVPVVICNGHLEEIEKSKVLSPFSPHPADWSENERIAKEAMQSANPDAALHLLAFMEKISEDCWSAGWITGHGHNLWTLLHKASTEPFQYGDLPLRPEDIQTLKMLNQQCQGWWYWDEQQDEGTIFVKQLMQSYL
ncbi:MAG: hypothetical protein PUP91_39380 [Rhizonema sp. PD37]|nr:hypothetical protein [Rhizonema sp. PD37]